MEDMLQSYLKHAKKYGEKNTTIDRINGKGHYSPENCRWATYKVQASNRRYENREKNFCFRGHPLSGKNIRLTKHSEGGTYRRCLKCKNILAKEWRAKNRIAFLSAAERIKKENGV